MMEEKIHVTEVGELSSEITKGIDEHIMAERGMSEETIETESVGVPAVEEVIEKGPMSSSFQLPGNCPACNSTVTADGAHIICRNDVCCRGSSRSSRMGIFTGDGIPAQLNFELFAYFV